MTLEIAGKPFTEYHRIAIRFVLEQGNCCPQLYIDGKRVTKGWTFQADWDMPADAHGDNANTAEIA